MRQKSGECSTNGYWTYSLREDHAAGGYAKIGLKTEGVDHRQITTHSDERRTSLGNALEVK